MTLLAYWGIAWAIGIWMSSLLAIPAYAWAGGALTVILAAALARSERLRLALSCLAAFALGATRLTLAQPRFDAHSLVTYSDGGRATLVGVVAEEPDVRDNWVYYKLDAESLALGEDEGAPLSVHGAARLRAPRYPLYAYGDRLRVRGSLEKPPVWEDFDYQDYLTRRAIYSYVPWAEVEWLTSGEGSTWKRLMLDFKDKALLLSLKSSAEKLMYL